MRALTTNGQTFAMAQATIGSEIHQTFNVHRHIAAQVTFDLVMFVDIFTNAEDFSLCQLIDAFGWFDANAGTNLHSVSGPNSINVTQGYMQRFCRGNIYTCNTCHLWSP